MKILSYEAAHDYIEGEAFDPMAYEREHLQMLLKSGKDALKSVNPEYRRNLKRTVLHWIEVNREKGKQFPELDELKKLAASI